MSSTRIEWADAVWNPITGCTPVSEGCRNCYAKRMAQRMRGRFGYPKDDPFRPGTFHKNKLFAPMKWRRTRSVFVCSMGDIFHEDVPIELIAKVWSVMNLCPQHIFMVLTKRPERMRGFLKTAGLPHPDSPWITHDRTPPIAIMADGKGTGHIVAQSGAWPLPNVWLGVSVEDQQTADERIPVLLQTPATVRFVSCEPLLGPVDLEAIPYDPEGYEGFPGMHNALTGEWWPAVGDAEAEYRGRLTELPKIDWVICGSETGPKRRPARLGWIRSLKDQCVSAGVPFFLKQMEVGGRVFKMPWLDGRKWNQWPGEA